MTENGLTPGDADYVNRVASIGEKTENLVSYVYENAVSPHLAAMIEGNPVEMDVIKAAYQKAASKYNYIIQLLTESTIGIIKSRPGPAKWINFPRCRMTAFSY